MALPDCKRRGEGEEEMLTGCLDVMVVFEVHSEDSSVFVGEIFECALSWVKAESWGSLISAMQGK